MGAGLTAHGLVKEFAGVAAVDGVDLNVKPGEFVSLLGPSGCGKTTTLRMIAGLEQVDEGEIRINGEDVTDLPPQKRHLGMVFQNYALFPNLSAFENVAYALRVRRRPRAEITARVNEMLDLVHLTDAARKYPHELSGGMQQRVALARALAISPSLLLLDEPLSALDAAIRESLRAELRRLHIQLDVTVIYVTHDQAEAMSLSDTVVVMEKGKVSQSGTPQELYNHPKTRFTASFVGASNRQETTVERSGQALAIRWGEGSLLLATGSEHEGARVIATWRPEIASLHPEAGETSTGLSGIIELVTFLGPITRFDIRVNGAEEAVMVDVPSNGSAAFLPGQRVSISVPPDQIRLFPL